jgi:hypothetical protein
MVTELAEGALIIAPLFLGFIVHGLCIRLGALRGFATPIKRPWFGENKTYRGLVCVALGTAVGFVVIDPPFLSLGSEHRAIKLALLGVLVGAAAMLAELPNSFLKRCRISCARPDRCSVWRLGASRVGGQAHYRTAGRHPWHGVHRASTRVARRLLARHAHERTVTQSWK